MGVIQNAIEREVLGDQLFDPEKDGMEPPKRPFLLVHALSVAVAFILVVVVEMACVAKVCTDFACNNRSRQPMLTLP